MLASELVAVLQKIIVESGDLPVMVPDEEVGGDYDLKTIKVRNEETSFMEKEPRPPRNVIAIETREMSIQDGEIIYFSI